MLFAHLKSPAVPGKEMHTVTHRTLKIIVPLLISGAVTNAEHLLMGFKQKRVSSKNSVTPIIAPDTMY